MSRDFLEDARVVLDEQCLERLAQLLQVTEGKASHEIFPMMEVMCRQAVDLKWDDGVLLLLRSNRIPNSLLETVASGVAHTVTSNLEKNPMVRSFIGFVESTNEFKRHGLTPLHYAAESSRVELLRKVFRLQPDTLRVGDRNGSTPLHTAIFRRRTENALFLIEVGADLEAKDASGRTPVWEAIWFLENTEELRIVQALLDRGCSPYQRDGDGKTMFEVLNQRHQEESPCGLYSDYHWSNISLEFLNLATSVLLGEIRMEYQPDAARAKG